jgi:branched-chain amino acid transport system ATP-binding protein
VSGARLGERITPVSLLEVADVSKSFGGVRAVSHVSFTVSQGDVLGVMGPNGSGKSTLLNLIAGAFGPDAGRIRLDGHDIAGRSAHAVCGEGIARTFQLVRPFMGLSVEENVLVGHYYGRRHRPHSLPHVAADQLLERVGLAGKGSLRPGQLTVMDRKRVELARALAAGPRLLLLDEFLAGLTPTETEGAMSLIKGLQREGLTLIMVEHIVWALLDLSQRVLVLSAGEKIADGAPADIAADATVIDVYLGTSGIA